MSEQLLQVKNLVVNVEDTEILHGIDLEINRGETHVLMGPNGAGKSTLGYALMGSPRYQLTNGQIWFKGQDITEESTDKRAKAGLFLSFQNPLEVPGITLGNFPIRQSAAGSGTTARRIWRFWMKPIPVWMSMQSAPYPRESKSSRRISRAPCW